VRIEIHTYLTSKKTLEVTMKVLLPLVCAVIHMAAASRIPMSHNPAAYNYTGCGITTVGKSRRAVGGQDVTHKEWPWMAYYVSKGAGGWGSGCGGTILTANCVLTAAHCIDLDNPTGFNVYGGLHDKTYIDRDWNVQKRTAAQTTIHPDYEYDSSKWQLPTHDVAVIRLNEPFDFSKEAVNSVCMPTPDSTYAGEDGTALGWGKTTFGGDLASVLQEVTYPIMDDSDARCKKGVAPWELCAAHPSKGTCHADSGGPMVVQGADGKWSLVGVNSYSISAASGSCINPDFFMRVSYFSDWIMKTCLYK